jgi:hypothetical protein
MAVTHMWAASPKSFTRISKRLRGHVRPSHRSQYGGTW